MKPLLDFPHNRDHPCWRIYLANSSLNLPSLAIRQIIHVHLLLTMITSAHNSWISNKMQDNACTCHYLCSAARLQYNLLWLRTSLLQSLFPLQQL
jgi:hypothetical protein